MKLKNYFLIKPAIIVLSVFTILFSCDKAENGKGTDDPDDQVISPPYSIQEFVMGADLSYLNQIVDKKGQYAGGKDPWQIFAEAGTNLVRLRLWNNPEWIKRVYDNSNEELYSGLDDVLQAAKKAQQNGMDLCLDIHYSDTWADPGKQITPEVWKDLNLELLKDSVYAYTYDVLNQLLQEGIIPAYVQIGNEINPGMLHPLGHINQNNWKNLGDLLNSGIQAVRDLYQDGDAPKIVIHIAQPENVRWYFNNLTILGQVSDFEVIGISYYPIWSTVALNEMDGYIRKAKVDFDKEVMIMETAFPWTQESQDTYTNIFGTLDSLSSYPVSPEGQLGFMKNLCQEVIDGGGSGVVYWEPGWISSEMKTQWGQGSAWENCSFFDFHNNNSVLPVVEYITFDYTFEP